MTIKEQKLSENCLENLKKQIPLKEQRKQQQIQQKKEEIVLAVKELFYEQGILQTTMEDIAKKSQFSVGALYSFFPSKTLLYEEVLKKIFSEFLESIRKKLETKTSLQEKVFSLIEFRILHFEKHNQFYKNFFQLAMQGNFAESKDIFQSLQNFYLSYLKEMMVIFCEETELSLFDLSKRKNHSQQKEKEENLQQKNLEKSWLDQKLQKPALKDPLYLALLLDGFLQNSIRYWELSQSPLSLEEKCEKIFSLFIEVL